MKKENCKHIKIWDYLGWKTDKPSPFTQKDWNQTLMTKINWLSALIYKDSLRGGADTVEVGLNAFELIKDLEYYNEIDNKLASRYNVELNKDIDANSIFLYLKKAYFDDLNIPIQVKSKEDGYIDDLVFMDPKLLKPEFVEDYRKSVCGCLQIENYPTLKQKNRLISNEKNIDLIQDMLPYKDLTLNEYKPLTLSKAQKKVLYGIEDSKYTVIRKDRQTGISTLLAAMIACELAREEPKNIIMFSPSRQLGYYTNSKITDNIKILIKNLELDISFIIKNCDKLELSNGSSIIFKSTNQDVYTSMCSIDISDNTWVIFDEIASSKDAYSYYEYIRNFRNPKITIISTQYGLDKLFFPIYLLGQKAGYNRINATWTEGHDGLSDKISKISKYKNNNEMLREFSDVFVVDNADKIDFNIINELIKSHLLKNEKYTLLEFVEYIQSGMIKVLGKEKNNN